MAARTAVEAAGRPGWSGTVLAGAAAGIVAGLVMAMYAMVASATFLGQGFFTPMHGIAAPVVGMDAMERSMQAGAFHLEPLPALVGLVGHMMWAVIFGVLFALIARAIGLAGLASLVVGVVFGLAVMLFMSYAVLPIFGLAAMPGMVGWTSFTIEHAIFGGVLGLWPLMRPGDVRARVTA